MKEYYVSYDCAVKLKDLGFDWKCDHYWDKEFADIDKMFLRKALNKGNFNNEYWSLACSAPRLDQAAAWLWEKYKLWIEVTIKAKNDFTLCIVDEYGEVKFIGEGKDSIPNTYIAGIDKALELLGKEEKE